MEEKVFRTSLTNCILLKVRGAAQHLFLHSIIVIILLAAISSVGGCGIEPHKVCFSPMERCDKVLIDEVDLAQKTIHVAVFSFSYTTGSSQEIAKALMRAKSRGVEVKLILDWKSQASSNQGTCNALCNDGIAVRMRRLGGKGYMHHKYTIIDGHTVLMGSYNYSQNATTKNDENLNIINSPELAAQFEDNFQKLWREELDECNRTENRCTR